MFVWACSMWSPLKTALTFRGNRKSMTTRGFHVTKCYITGRGLIPVYIKVFFDSPFSFIIFLYHVFDSLKRRLRLNSHFSQRVSSTDRHSDLVTFFHSFLTTGCNYLMRVPALPWPDPTSHLSLPIHVQQYLRLDLCLFIWSIHCLSLLACLTVCLTDWSIDRVTDWQTTILPFFSPVKVKV